MKAKIWYAILIIVVFVIIVGVVRIKSYNENIKEIEDQISEGAKKEAVEYFQKEENKEFTPTGIEFISEMSSIIVYGYFKDDPEQEWHASMTYGKADNGYDYDVGSTGEVLADSMEEYLEKKEEDE